MSGSAWRYRRRQGIWQEDHRVLPLARHHVWWLLHNCVSHPLLGIRPSTRVIWFHDWTSKHLNQHPGHRTSPPPVIPNRRAWAWHNIAGHIAIGLAPIEVAFAFHDRTSKAMNVKHWL